MKYGLLVTSPISSHKNIGDYVQSLAALTFTPKVDYYVEKENASSDLKANDDFKTIMNAWYMWHPENWPPNRKIIPLLTSVHITPLTADEMISKEKEKYLIDNGPIGCRDLGTLDILEKKNIPSYFSGCLTLTLREKYKSNKVSEGVVFVDPFIAPIRNVLDGQFVYYFENILKSIFYFFKNPRAILKLSKKKYFSGRFWFLKYYNASMFYNAYKTKFTKETLLTAKYLTHMLPVTNDESQENLLKRAEDLVKLYAESKLVVTSRIHCALPCLGLETPVIFVLNDDMNSKKNLFNAPDRFGGIINFFRVINYSTNKISTNDEVLSEIALISKESNIENKNSWVKYKDKLVEQCKSFMS